MYLSLLDLLDRRHCLSTIIYLLSTERSWTSPALSFMGPWVPSLAVFLSWVLGFASHVTRLCFFLVVRWLRPPSPALDVWFFFHADSWFRPRARLSRSFVSSRLTASFWPSSSTSCYFRAALCATSLLGLFLQLHLVVVYSDVACGGHSSTAV